MFLESRIININKVIKPKNLFRNKKIINVVNPLPGTEIGIPLFFLETLFTELHYGYNINNKDLFFFQTMLGFFTYGTDRLLDSLNNKKEDEFNKYLRENKEIMTILLGVSFIYITRELISVDETKIMLLPLTSTLFYRDLKKKYGELKPIYIGVFWTLASIIIPCIWHDNSYEILQDPLNYMPCFLSLVGTSNLADIKDIEEDKENGINTWGVRYGKRLSINFSILLVFLSTILVGFNKNLNNFPIESTIFELQNIGSLVYAGNLSSELI